MTIVIYTDGACSGNPGPGGWGAWLLTDGHKKEMCGGETNTTNNRMEMTAAIKALEALKNPSVVTIHTDSTYLRDGITKWIFNWKKNGWRTSAKKPVKNAELWQALEAAIVPHQVQWEWVKGHSGDPGNEKADQLANQGMAEFKR